MTRDWMKDLKGAYLGVFGIPDYEAYLEHMARRHPDQAVLSHAEFARRYIDRRYGGMRSRCC